MARLLFTLLWLLYALAGHAQRFYFENLSVQQGLPASKVYTVLQDATGMVWLGTEAGLASYDGNTVRSLGSAAGLAQNGVYSLLLDSKGRLWAGHLGGGVSIRERRQFRRIELDKPLNSDVTAIIEDGEGAIWLLTFGNGAVRIPAISDGALTTERFGEAQGVADKLVGGLQLKDGSLLFLEASGTIKRWNKGFAPYRPAGVPEDARVTALYQADNGDVWFGTFTGGAIRVEAASGRVSTFDIQSGMPSNFVFCFGEDAEGRVWVGTWDGGVARIEPKGIRTFAPHNGLHSIAIRCLVKDREGNMLIGTTDNGLDIYKGDRFITFGEADGLVEPQVWALAEDQKGRVWFGTNGGISILDPSLTSTSRVRNLSTQQGELTSNRVRCLREDARGRMWIGTEDGGLIEFDPATFRFRYEVELMGSIAENKVTALEMGRNGEVWVGTINGLVKHVPGQLPTRFTVDDGLASNHVMALYRDPDGVLWVGSTMRGVSRVDDGKVKAVDLGRAFSATCFVSDKSGLLWVGTEGQGILLVKDGKVVDELDVEAGLLSNSIRSLALDNEGLVWIGTNKGLNVWRGKEKGFVAYTERSGFTGIEAKPGAVRVTREGDLWFGTANGATRVGRSSTKESLVPPLIAIRGLKVNLEDRVPGENISLPHTDRNVRIEYGCVSLSDPAAVRYQFMLAGLDQEWQPVTYEADVHYPTLPPGRYTFKVKAINHAGVWSEPPAELRFTILPPWWQSWWFYAAVAVFVAVVLFSYIKVRERQLRARNLILERRVQERTAEVVRQSEEIAGQKVQIENLLLNILPKRISEELRNNGRATARHHDGVTVMFTDMKGFTQVAERMTPEELVNELDDCFIRFDDIIGRYGIEKIKTIGDSYMCACGVPSPEPHHAHKMLLAAMEVREEMRRWQREKEASGQQPWVLRIGLHSGPVVAGVVGKRKFAYDIWGDTVNTASRMESSGSPGEINISGATHEMVKDRFECEHRGKVDAKNKGQIDMYFVRRIRPEFSADAEGTLPNARFMTEVGVKEAEAVS
ncbi:MAG: hypothetical protein JNM31_06320 [Flavobacteriales bacterium]|nr:hypothetical protein [Flavobacteriales bacterium]